MERHLTEHFSCIVIKLNGYNSPLDDEHLLQVGDLPFEGLMIVWRLEETGRMRQQSELERRLGLREKSGLFHWAVAQMISAYRVPLCSINSMLMVSCFFVILIQASLCNRSGWLAQRQ